jgi:hypothetical protein
VFIELLLSMLVTETTMTLGDNMTINSSQVRHQPWIFSVSARGQDLPQQTKSNNQLDFQYITLFRQRIKSVFSLKCGVYLDRGYVQNATV